MDIMFQRGPETLEERLTATYLRALKPDVFSGFRYHRYPMEPAGFREDFDKYQKISSPDARAEAWRNLNSRYGGFFKARNEAKHKNSSDIKFLNEAYEHLKKVGAFTQAEQYKTRLDEYAIEARMGY